MSQLDVQSNKDQDFVKHVVTALATRIQQDLSHIPLDSKDYKSKISHRIDELIETNQYIDLPSNLDNSEIYYERVQAKQREYEKRKEDLKRKQDEEYKQIYTFTPKLNDTSIRLAEKRSVSPIHERVNDIIKEHDDKIRQYQEEEEKYMERHLVFKPDIINPCICGVGLGDDRFDENELKKHEPYCQRYMLLYPQYLQPYQTNKKKRTVEDLYNDSKIKQSKLEENKRKYEEAKQYRYSPTINIKSKKIMNKIKRKNGYLEPQNKPDQRIGHENDIFHPKLNRISRNYKPIGSKNVYSRLYTMGMSKKQIPSLENGEDNDNKDRNTNYEICPVVQEPVVNVVVYEPQYSFLLKAALASKT